MTLQEISELTIEKVFPDLLNRIIDLSNLPAGSPAYQIDLDNTKPFYERVIVHQSLVKPSLQLFTDELEEYKAELTSYENARIAEIDRVEDIKLRFGAIGDIRGAIMKAGLSIINPAIELERIIKENDQPRLIELESAYTEFQAEETEKAAKRARAEVSRRLVDMCHGCVQIIMEHNIDNGLSGDQKDQQSVDYAPVFDALQKWRPGKFKNAVSAISPDGTLVTQAMKDELLAFLSENGL